jgi:hypothetical protein
VRKREEDGVKSEETSMEGKTENLRKEKFGGALILR